MQLYKVHLTAERPISAAWGTAVPGFGLMGGLQLRPVLQLRVVQLYHILHLHLSHFYKSPTEHSRVLLLLL